jgi:hypothetical protein
MVEKERKAAIDLLDQIIADAGHCSRWLEKERNEEALRSLRLYLDEGSDSINSMVKELNHILNQSENNGN